MPPCPCRLSKVASGCKEPSQSQSLCISVDCEFVDSTVISVDPIYDVMQQACVMPIQPYTGMIQAYTADMYHGVQQAQDCSSMQSRSVEWTSALPAAKDVKDAIHLHSSSFLYEVLCS